MSKQFAQLSDDVFISGQITLDDIETAKSLGIKMIIQNRPDKEAFGQLASLEIEAAANAAGLQFAMIPIDSAGLTHDHVDAFLTAKEKAAGPILCFCKSGLRSVMLRSYAEARAGTNVDTLIEQATSAGYRIDGHRQALGALSSD